MVTLSGIRAVVFDAYGTLFDWASAAERSRDVLGERWRELAEIWRTKQLQYTWLRSLQGNYADFWQVTGDALDFAMSSLGLADETLRARLLALYEHVDAYPDARETLQRLRSTGRRTAVLSNGTSAMISTATEAAGLSSQLDAILSADEVRIYKPHPAVYELAIARLSLRPAEILFVSSNGWDAFSARAFGFRVAWCNRGRQPPERLPERPDAEVHCLAEVTALLE